MRYLYLTLSCVSIYIEKIYKMYTYIQRTTFTVAAYIMIKYNE